MTEECFIGEWADPSDSHAADDLERLRRIIGAAYDARPEKPSDFSVQAPHVENFAARSMLTGLAATGMTVVLLVTTALLATPGVILA